MPPGLTGIMAIAGGGGFSLVLRTNGAVTAWGENSFGQTNVPSPAATTLVAAIAAGGYHSVALKENGTVVTWGRNNVGQTNTPSILTAGNATLNAIAAGDSHSLALKGTGAPVITCQPLDQITSAGSNANFAVLATGSGVLFYSWFLNGSNVLSGSNKKIFTRTNVQPADMGDCFVIVSNVSGMTTSAVANLFLNGTFSLDALGPTNFPGGGGFVVRLNGIPGNYIIQISSNLTNWTDAHTSTVPASGFVDWLDLNPLPVRRFYRARLP